MRDEMIREWYGNYTNGKIEPYVVDDTVRRHGYPVFALGAHGNIAAWYRLGYHRAFFHRSGNLPVGCIVADPDIAASCLAYLVSSNFTAPETRIVANAYRARIGHHTVFATLRRHPSLLHAALTDARLDIVDFAGNDTDGYSVTLHYTAVAGYPPEKFTIRTDGTVTARGKARNSYYHDTIRKFLASGAWVTTENSEGLPEHDARGEQVRRTACVVYTSCGRYELP